MMQYLDVVTRLYQRWCGVRKADRNVVGKLGRFKLSGCTEL